MSVMLPPRSSISSRPKYRGRSAGPRNIYPRESLANIYSSDSAEDEEQQFKDLIQKFINYCMGVDK